MTTSRSGREYKRQSGRENSKRRGGNNTKTKHRPRELEVVVSPDKNTMQTSTKNNRGRSVSTADG